MPATTSTVPHPISSNSSSPPEPGRHLSPSRAVLELNLRLQHQQQPVVTTYPAASGATAKSRARRHAKPPPPKKQPQRGLGVAQLERLRLQERWKKLIEIPGSQQQLPGPMASDDPQVVQHFHYLQAGVPTGGNPHLPPPPPSPFQYPVADNTGGALPQFEAGGRCLPPGVYGMGRGYVVGNPVLDGWDGVNNGPSRELSSMPNARALVPDHHLYLTAGMNGKVKPVVGGVVLEYEFFPGKRCRNTWNEEQSVPSVRGEGRAGTSAEASNPIDLSLKL